LPLISVSLLRWQAPIGRAAKALSVATFID
jgi:hypothetical protein